MVQACLFLLAGVYALQLSSFAVGSDLYAVAFVAFFVAIFLGAWRNVSWLLAGAGLFAFAAAGNLESRLAPQYAGDSIVANIRVADFPEQRGSSVVFIAEPLLDARLPRRIRISWFEPPGEPRFGDVWKLEVRLRRPRGNLNPGVFDYEAWLFRRKIGATGYVVNGRRNQRVHSDELGPVERLRQRFVDRLEDLLPSRQSASVLAAISVGARHLVTREQWERYGNTGTSHLMAISGLHIGLAAAGGYLVTRLLSGFLWRRGNHRVRATLAAVFVAGIYALVSGLAVPSQRAASMLAMLALATLRRRQAHPALILAAACAMLGAAMPVATMAPGFKLSFAAVAILIWLACRHDRSSRRGAGLPLVTAIRRLGIVQVFLLLGLLPLTASLFGRITFVAPPANLIAVPVFSLVTVPFTLAGLVLDGPLEMVGDGALFIAARSVEWVERLVAAAASVPAALFRVPRMEGWDRVYLFVPLVWVVLPPGWPGRSLAWLGVAALIAYEPGRPAPGCVELDVLDVGQGLAAVLMTHSQVLLYDTGPAYRGGGSAAETVILPYLAAQGIVRIDTLIVSHSDLDHAGGLASLLSGVDVRKMLVGESLPGAGESSRSCRAGDGWQIDGIDFRVIHPVAGTTYRGNDASCVLLVEVGKHRLLFSGDIEKAAEDDVVSRDALPPVAVAMIPHHGSRTSSSARFVQAARPALAIASTGFRNRWGFPKADIVDRWRGVGATVLDTGLSGTVSVGICAATGIGSVRQYRRGHRRIWHE